MIFWYKFLMSAPDPTDNRKKPVMQGSGHHHLWARLKWNTAEESRDPSGSELSETVNHEQSPYSCYPLVNAILFFLCIKAVRLKYKRSEGGTEYWKATLFPRWSWWNLLLEKDSFCQGQMDAKMLHCQGLIRIGSFQRKTILLISASAKFCPNSNFFKSVEMSELL